MNALERQVRRVDAFQQRHGPVAAGFAVVKKFGDDRGGALAALLAYYGFLAVFPLLLLLVTVLGRVMGTHPGVERAVLNSALADFPIIGTELRSSIHPLRGSGAGLAVGLGGLVWGSLGVAQAAQLAMAQVWNVPADVRPNFWSRLARSLILFATLAAALVVTTALGSLSTSGSGAGVFKTLTVTASVALNVGLYFAAFRITTPRSVRTAQLAPGAVVGGVGWSLLQALGSYLVVHQLRNASQVYGYFASVLGLVSWLYLGATLTLYAAELNVVRARRLWPRSIVQPPLTDADRRTFDAIARQEDRRPEQSVETRWHDS
jgi:YihY family inner membrane protein